MKLSKKQRVFTRMFFGNFFRDALAWADVRGYELMVTEVYRSEASARANAAAGTGIVNSNHRKKLACDLILWKQGKPVWNSDFYESLGKKWEAMSCLGPGGVRITCCWGGRFRRRDGHHFSFLHNGVK
jgi:hypothetical protein